VRKDRHVAAGDEDVGKAVVGGVMECCVEAARRAMVGSGSIGEARPADDITAADDGRVGARAALFDRKVDQAVAADLRQDLVTTEAARAAAGEDRAEDAPPGQAIIVIL
jgi:hypothetical protein